MEGFYLGNGKRWLFSELPQDNELLSNGGIPELIAKLLRQRDIKNEAEAKSFLNPSINDLHDPFLLEGMNEAADRIVRAIENKEKILVYGDYDVDGVAATSMLIRFFESQNIHADFYIPDRVDEGYGISDAAVEYISSKDYNLIITVDCGITARSQVKAIYENYAQKGRNIDIIVTDHHQYSPDLMPEAFAVIDHQIPGCKYPFKHLCGAGLALKLIQALGIKLGKPDAFMEYIDIAALATVADIVELKGENRVITKFGMAKMSTRPCVGIKALMKASGAKTIDSYILSFALAPRINAAGRMGDAKCAVRLFTTDDEAEADKIALLLNQSNLKRKEVQDDIFFSAVKAIEEDQQYRHDKVLVVHGDNWHPGVIGIVASKLVDRYNKPSIVISVEGTKAVGSARSIEGFNIFHAMENCSDILVKFGGHEMAGGLTLETDNIEIFRRRINEYAHEHITDEMLVPAINIDLEAKDNEISIEMAKFITRLGPFGAGNNAPVFCYRGAILLHKRAIGNNKHLKLSFNINNQTVNGVWFGRGDYEKGLFAGQKVDIVFTQEINVWQNVETVQINVLDMRLSDKDIERNKFFLNAAQKVECLDYSGNWLYNGIIDKIVKYDDIVINRDDLAIIYKYINCIENTRLSLIDMFIHAGILEEKTRKGINGFKFFTALLVFDELGLLELNLDTDGTYSINLYKDKVKVNLEDSEILCRVRQAAERC